MHGDDIFLTAYKSCNVHMMLAFFTSLSLDDFQPMVSSQRLPVSSFLVSGFQSTALTPLPDESASNRFGSVAAKFMNKKRSLPERVNAFAVCTHLIIRS